MKTRCIISHRLWGAAIVGMLAGIFGVAHAEESSILQGATMSGNEILTNPTWPALDNSLIAGNYKVKTHSDTTNSNNGKKEFVISWLEAQEFVSCFVANRVSTSDKNIRFGHAQFWAGDDVTAYSLSLSKCSGDVYDTGFYALT